MSSQLKHPTHDLNDVEEFEVPGRIYFVRDWRDALASAKTAYVMEASQ